MGLGRYVTNMGLISALFSGVGVRKQTREMPRDWRRYLVWASWALSLVLAFASVRKADEDNAYIERQKELDARLKEREKAAKKAARKSH